MLKCILTEDLIAPRDLCDRKKQGHGFLLSWYEAWRLSSNGHAWHNPAQPTILHPSYHLGGVELNYCTSRAYR